MQEIFNWLDGQGWALLGAVAYIYALWWVLGDSKFSNTDNHEQ